MLQFTVDKDTRVTIYSSRSAAYNQKFTVERQSPTQAGWWEGMGKKVFFGGESATFLPFSQLTTWRITCEHDNDGWRYSRERISGAGTPRIIIECDDDSSGDNDFNDLVVKISLGAPAGGGFAGIVPAEPVPEYEGDGNYQPPKKEHHSGPTKKGNLIIQEP